MLLPPRCSPLLCHSFLPAEHQPLASGSVLSALRRAKMALFVELDDDDVEPPQNLQGGKPVWNGDGRAAGGREEAHEPAERENPNRNSTTAALGCYP